jgi:hypothetical protein
VPLEVGTYWKLVCDVHGPEGFEGDAINYIVAESEKEGRELVEDRGGRIEPDGRVLCSACVEEATEGESDG